MKIKSQLQFAGIPENGKTVIKGIYRCFETTGLPLDVIVSWIKENDFIPSWYDYLTEATNAGINFERIKSRLEEVIVDIYGNHYWKIVKFKLESRTSGTRRNFSYKIVKPVSDKQKN